MANGSSNGNGNGNGHYVNGYWNTVSKQSLGLLGSELGSIGVSLGVVALADQVAGGPLKLCSKALSKVIFEPYLDTIEAGLGKVCKLEECKKNEDIPREQRAENLAHNSIIFGASFAAAMASKLWMRQKFDEVMKIRPAAKATADWGQWAKAQLGSWKNMNKGDWLIFAMDEGAHIGSTLYLNMGAAKSTDALIRTTTDVLQNAGFSKEKAHEIASYSYIWEVPNLIGFASGVGGIMIAKKIGWTPNH